MQQLNPLEWAILPIRKYATFSGRAPRAEYWWFYLASTIVGLGVGFLDPLVGGPVVGSYRLPSLILNLGLLIPNISVTVRRLHDIDRTGSWILLVSWSYALALVDKSWVERAVKSVGLPAAVVLLLMLLGSGVMLLVFMVSRGTEGPNEYGPDPYGPSQLQEVFA